jgi:hypothetical protein
LDVSAVRTWSSVRFTLPSGGTRVRVADILSLLIYTRQRASRFSPMATVNGDLLPGSC